METRKTTISIAIPCAKGYKLSQFRPSPHSLQPDTAMEFTITRDFHNVRLDKFLRKTYQEIPQTGIYKMIRKGNVKVNRKKKRQNYRLQEGDTVRVWEASAPTVAKITLQLTREQQQLAEQIIVYQDDDILICNKPAGMVMHTGSRHESGLGELILSHIRNPQFTFVHRIDKMTSGLVMGAKNLPTARKLSRLIRERAVHKEYVVLVEGRVEPQQFTIRNFLRNENDRVRSCRGNSNGAREAVSDFTVLDRSTNRTLLQARLHTGRKHQLRVQLANRGHPIVGDRKYGKSHRTHEKQMFLFSRRLQIPSIELDFSLSVPDSFLAALLEKSKTPENR